MYIKVKVKHLKQTNTGKFKTATDTYVFKADSFTEAETRASEALSDRLIEPYVKAASFADFAEVRGVGEGPYYLAKITFTETNEITGAESKSSFKALFKATSLDDALSKANHAKPAGFDIEGLNLTNIKEVRDA